MKLEAALENDERATDVTFIPRGWIFIYLLTFYDDNKIKDDGIKDLNWMGQFNELHSTEPSDY